MSHPRWLAWWKPAPAARQFVRRGVELCTPLTQFPYALLVCLLLGTLPVLLAYALRWPIHQFLTALGLTPLLLVCVRQDRLFRAMLLVGSTLMLHSATVIALSASDAGTADILPGAANYWGGIWKWIATGEDQEYRWADWLPAHLKLFFGLPLATYPSFGLIPFIFGIEQLDLMNFYVGRLITVSQSPTRAVLFGWHPWSLLRGTAYTVLIFEVTSYSLQRFLGEELSPPRRRLIRWLAALILAIGDGLLKLMLAPTLREWLYANLQAEAAELPYQP